MADKIKRFIECLVPVTACNLKCHYCYVIQHNNRNNQMPAFKYSAQHIAKALSKERWGGKMLINICGMGETLLPAEIINITLELLKEGHYINITTNGTLDKRFQEFAKFDKNLLERLQFSFSFHYLELKEKGLLNSFFKNIEIVKNAGASILVQFNLCDEYIPHFEAIKKLCLNHVGALPHVALTRKHSTSNRTIEIFSDLTKDEYYNKGKEFESRLWDFTNINFQQSKKDKFCFAGDWSFRLDLASGDLKRCYFEQYSQNIYDNIDKPIIFCPIGKSCKSQYCENSSHYLSLGNIPQIITPTYSELRNRTCTDGSNWQTPKMEAFLSSKLYENNTTIDMSAKGFLFYKLKAFNFVITKLFYKLKLKLHL